MAAAGYQIHKQQLFHWIGQSIQRQNKGRKVLSDALAQKALDHIRGSLESGLWVKTPNIPERLKLGDDSFALKTPITCFTEWSLGDSLPHTENYGRIGFGFPKRWVIDCGGQSVTYFHHSKRCNFLRGMFSLLKCVANPLPDGEWEEKRPNCGLEHLTYLLHFAKRDRAPLPASKRLAKAAMKAKKARKAKGAGDVPSAPLPNFRRRYGVELNYVEEREWRVVYHPSNSHFKRGTGTPQFYLPYVPGDELFTLVVPDNKVMSKLLASSWFTKRLFTPHLVKDYKLRTAVPPVTILAHSDLGTF